MRTRRQRLGQHFLRDGRIAEAIVAALPAEPTRVLEIGAGRGALTEALLRRFPRVRAVELDSRLADSLSRRLGEAPGLEVRRADALQADLDELGAGGPWLVAANLPYSVGTAIIRRLLPRHDLFVALVVMVQEEVARRLAAFPNDGQRGLLSVEVEAHAACELLFGVPRRAFAPPPRVNSAVVGLRLRPPSAPPPVVTRALELAGRAFQHRRKTMANALAGCAGAVELGVLLDGVGVGRNARPQELTLAAWLELARALPASDREE